MEELASHLTRFQFFWKENKKLSSKGGVEKSSSCCSCGLRSAGSSVDWLLIAELQPTRRGGATRTTPSPRTNSMGMFLLVDCRGRTRANTGRLWRRRSKHTVMFGVSTADASIFIQKQREGPTTSRVFISNMEEVQLFDD